MIAQAFINLLARVIVVVVLAALALVVRAAEVPKDARPPEKTIGPDPQLPAPFHTPSARKFSKVIGWPEGKTPVAIEGFKVQKFAAGLENPRWPYVLPDGSVLVAESSSNKEKSANRITRLRDADGDGVAEVKEVFLDKLNQPFGMLLLGDSFYVANTNGVVRYSYNASDKNAKPTDGKQILDLPAEGYNNHWTRNIIAGPDGKKLYVSVGSATNVDENLNVDAKDPRRAAILECNPDGSEMRVYGAGLRNPTGMDFEPATQMLWTAVNERDALGDDLAPDYVTSVKEGGFYGWPYAYFGPNVDPRHKDKRPDLVAKTIRPDVALGAHTSSMGLQFYTDKAFPPEYHGGLFVVQRGSWNRSEFAGYRVLFLPFKDGRPTGEARDFVSGWIADAARSEVYGRPTGLDLAPDGALILTDDAANTVWRISPK